ncbi:MAG: hypothetical protein HYS80_01760 [Candidatus Aenigmarchaeota archaeon]|nr:hypothetical protein [Candidatus Aenigmarchaeota archaeon]
MFLFGCESALPPEPGSPSVPVGRAGGYYDGYGVPYDVYNNDTQIFFLNQNVFNIEPEQRGFRLGVAVEQEGGYVYRYGHYYTNGGWRLFEFLDQRVSGSNWIKDRAEAFLGINTVDITPGENYIVAYSCKKYAGAWRCGCTYQGGPCNQWMIQTYLYRSVELPPEPIAPGSIITTQIWVSPNGEIVRQGNSVYPYVSASSTQDILREADEDINLRIVKPDRTYESILVNRIGDVNCKECSDNNCYRQFSCYLNYDGKFTPTLLGEHLVDFGEIGEIPNSWQIQTGKFKVVDNNFFTQNLIENEIGSLEFDNSWGYYDSDGYYLSAGYSNGVSGIYASAFSDYKWIKDSEAGYQNNPDWVKTEINGNTVFVNTQTRYEGYYNEVISVITTDWFSNGKFIRVYVYGADTNGYDEVVVAYLERYPSSGQVAPINPISVGVNVVGYGFGNTYHDPGTLNVRLFRVSAWSTESFNIRNMSFEFRGTANPHLTNIRVIDDSTSNAVASAATLPDGYSLAGPHGAVTFNMDVSVPSNTQNTQKTFTILADVSSDLAGGSTCPTCSLWVYAALMGVGFSESRFYASGRFPYQGNQIEFPYIPLALRSCTDSDGGLNYTTSGAAKSSIQGEIDIQDYCTSYGVFEQYCNAYKVVNGEDHACPNGCSNGACLELISQPPQSSTEEPSSRIVLFPTSEIPIQIGESVILDTSIANDKDVSLYYKLRFVPISGPDNALFSIDNPSWFQFAQNQVYMLAPNASETREIRLTIPNETPPGSYLLSFDIVDDDLPPPNNIYEHHDFFIIVS